MDKNYNNSKVEQKLKKNDSYEKIIFLCILLDKYQNNKINHWRL